jgi:hypothetical protein
MLQTILPRLLPLMLRSRHALCLLPLWIIPRTITSLPSPFHLLRTHLYLKELVFCTSILLVLCLGLHPGHSGGMLLSLSPSTPRRDRLYSLKPGRELPGLTQGRVTCLQQKKVQHSISATAFLVLHSHVTSTAKDYCLPCDPMLPSLVEPAPTHAVHHLTRDQLCILWHQHLGQLHKWRLKLAAHAAIGLQDIGLKMNCTSVPSAVWPNSTRPIMALRTLVKPLCATKVSPLMQGL